MSEHVHCPTCGCAMRHRSMTPEERADLRRLVLLVKQVVDEDERRREHVQCERRKKRKAAA